MAINVFEDITEHKESELRARFLADAATVLASSLDYETTLQQVAELAIPTFADGCIVELADADGQLVPVAMAHRDRREGRPDARAARASTPRSRARPRGVGHVFRTGDSELYAELDPETLRQDAPEDRQVELLEAVGVRSLMIVPMSTGGRRLGTIAFALSESGAPLRPRRPVGRRGARAARRRRDRQRAPLPRAQLHRAHAPGEPAAARAAGGGGRRGRRALPPGRRGDRGRRRLLRRVRHRHTAGAS